MHWVFFFPFVFSRATLQQDPATLLLPGDTLQPLALLATPLRLEVLDSHLPLGDQATLPLLDFPLSVALGSLVRQCVCVCLKFANNRWPHAKGDTLLACVLLLTYLL